MSLLRYSLESPVGFVGGFIAGYVIGLEKSPYAPLIAMGGSLLTYRQFIMPWVGFACGMLAGLANATIVEYPMTHMVLNQY